MTYSPVTKGLTAKAWEASLMCVWYVQYVEVGILMWATFYLY